MKKEELLEIGLTEEQASKVFAMNGKDVENAKGKLQKDVDTMKSQLAEAKETIATLEANKGDTAALQAELDKYKQAEEQRKQEEKDAAERAKILERFNAAKGDKEFSSEYAEKGVLDAFSKAIVDPANTGKGDAELFASLTHDKEGVFKSAHPPVNMGGFQNVEGGEPPKMPTFF
ncbi:phage scaffolding protein [Agathobaculum sp.]|uniref:phage scaffolding protein n=1 Tax=Agathobaculum sp. TaxID=2048138 RepID=UPI0039A0E1A2